MSAYTRKLHNYCMVRNWHNLICLVIMANPGSDWILVTFNVDLWPWELRYVCILYKNLGVNFWSLWPSSVIFAVEVGVYIFRIPGSRSSFKVVRSRQGHSSKKRAQAFPVIGYDIIGVKRYGRRLLVMNDMTQLRVNPRVIRSVNCRRVSLSISLSSSSSWLANRNDHSACYV